MVFKFHVEHWMYKRFPTTKVEKLLPRMRYEIPKDPIVVKGDKEWRRQMFGQQIRLKTIAKSVNDLIRDERLELSYYRAWETRNYTERLLMEAIRNGDRHRPTMEVANFYLSEKNLIHKLFKVLVPRYMNYSQSFTRMHLLPTPVSQTLNKSDGKGIHTTVLKELAVLELKGNPYPDVRNQPIESKYFLTNVLLREAQREYNNEKRKKASKTSE